MDIPELLHPLGSASYCTRAAAQISLKSAEKVVKNQQAINRSYLYLAEIKKWHEIESHMIEARDIYVEEAQQQ